MRNQVVVGNAPALQIKSEMLAAQLSGEPIE